jgi:hypothetical protein
MLALNLEGIALEHALSLEGMTDPSRLRTSLGLDRASPAPATALRA